MEKSKARKLLPCDDFFYVAQNVRNPFSAQLERVVLLVLYRWGQELHIQS